MRILSIVFLGLFVGISGCTTFNSIEVTSPKVSHPSYYFISEVNSLRPELSWLPLEEYNGTYDIVIFEAGQDDFWEWNKESKPVVYQKRGIIGTNHKLEISLKDKHVYFWSIKRSDKTEMNDWAKYNHYFFGVIVWGWATDQLFRFKTVLDTPLVLNNQLNN